tara:strand:+ start:184 stop:597 length:414 start_codon:yes stop_codon:yes gene_type:complete
MIPIMDTQGKWGSVKPGDILRYEYLDWEEERSETYDYIVLSITGEHSALLQECFDGSCDLVTLNRNNRNDYRPPKYVEEYKEEKARAKREDPYYCEETYDRDNLWFLSMETLDGDTLIEQDTMERHGWTLRTLTLPL